MRNGMRTRAVKASEQLQIECVCVSGTELGQSFTQNTALCAAATVICFCCSRSPFIIFNGVSLPPPFCECVYSSVDLRRCGFVMPTSDTLNLTFDLWVISREELQAGPINPCLLSLRKHTRERDQETHLSLNLLLLILVILTQQRFTKNGTAHRAVDKEETNTQRGRLNECYKNQYRFCLGLIDTGVV